MKKQLLVLSAVSVLIGGGGLALINTAIADQSTLIAQTSAPSPGKAGWGRKFDRLPGITDTQRTQLQAIHEASRQQIAAIPTAAQKAQLQAIRTDTKAKMEAVLTPEQRQQVQQAPADGQRKGPGFKNLSGLTDAQRTQIRQIHDASHQQRDAVLSAEQKAQMEAIRTDAKAKMNAILTAEQRQQLEQLRQQKRQNSQQQPS